MNKTEQVAHNILNILGFRDPEKHPDYFKILGEISPLIGEVSGNELFEKIAEQTIRRTTIKEILKYETYSSRLLFFSLIPGLDRLLANHFVRKVNRKYTKYLTMLAEQEKYLGTE